MSLLRTVTNEGPPPAATFRLAGVTPRQTSSAAPHLADALAAVVSSRDTFGTDTTAARLTLDPDTGPAGAPRVLVTIASRVVAVVLAPHAVDLPTTLDLAHRHNIAITVAAELHRAPYGNGYEVVLLADPVTAATLAHLEHLAATLQAPRGPGRSHPPTHAAGGPPAPAVGVTGAAGSSIGRVEDVHLVRVRDATPVRLVAAAVTGTLAAVTAVAASPWLGPAVDSAYRALGLTD